MFIRLLRTGFLCATLATVAFAQRGGGPQGGGIPGGPDGGFGAPGAGYMPSRLEMITDQLKLNKEQKSGAKEIFDAAQKEAASVREQIQKGRSALAAAYLSKHGQPEIDQLLATQGTVEAQMAGIELRAFAKLVDTLTPDQQKKVGPVFQQMAGMFSGRDWNRIGR